MRTISKRVRFARQAARITQSELADALDVSRSAVAQWESSTGSAPATQNLARLAVALHCSFEWLATGRGARRVSGKQAGDAEDSPDVAVVLTYFARDDEEENVLATFRRLPAFDRSVATLLLEQLASRPNGARARTRGREKVS